MLYETYTALLNDCPKDCNGLFGRAFGSDAGMWLSVDADAYPSLLFAASRDDARNDIELRSISVKFARDCVIQSADGNTITGTYSVVRLNENDPDVVRMLLRVLEDTFKAKASDYSSKEISDRILELADLFKQIANAPGDTLGLWGELYVLLRADDIQAAATSWSSSKNAKYDFVTEQFVLEVKSTVQARRKHRFSLDQLRPQSDFSVFVASLMVVELSSGRTTADLMDEAYERVEDEELRSRFLSQCLIKGGRDIYRSTLKLGVFPDESSLVIFEAASIPVPEIAATAPIENVRFDVDLSNVNPISGQERARILSFST